MKILSILKKLTIITAFFILGSSHAIDKNASATKEQVLQDRILGSIFGGCIGDALGKYTEFIDSRFKNPTAEQFRRFPGGLKCFKDLQKNKLVVNKDFAPYTDDTAMSKITLEVFIKARNENWNTNNTMAQLACAYEYDYFRNPQGWGHLERAPGNTCIRSIREINARLRRNEHIHNPKWWQAGPSGKDAETGKEQGIGCGSVMHAHVIGLFYADNPHGAGYVAALHSLITHGSQQAQAACAAMALGTAYAIQGKDPQFITEEMERIAKAYDKETAEKIADARLHGYWNHKNEKDLNKQFTISKPIFNKYLGWDAGDAIAAATYIFALTPDNISSAWYLGVHTPGDSDSIASMAGALVGARIGFKALTKAEPDWNNYENAQHLKNLCEDAAQVILNPGKSLKLSAQYPGYKTENKDKKSCDALFDRKSLEDKTPKKADQPRKQPSFTSSSYFRWGLHCLAIGAAAAVIYWWWK